MQKRLARSISVLLVVMLALAGLAAMPALAMEEEPTPYIPGNPPEPMEWEAEDPTESTAPAEGTGWSENHHYYYDRGLLLTGAQTIDGERYYFSETAPLGRVYTDTIYYDKAEKKYYCAGLDGAALVNDWYCVEDLEEEPWYYFGQDGAMVTGWQQIGSSWYYFDEQKGTYDEQLDMWLNPILGQRQHGWLWKDKNWYFLDPDTGAMATGLYMVGNRGYYYFSEEHDGSFGVMRSGWILLGDEYCYFDKDDGLITSGWVWDGKKWYYVDSEGHPLSGWQQIGGKTFYFNEKHDGSFGAMCSGVVKVGDEYYFLDKDNGLVKSGWASYKNGWYYVDDEGHPLTGWRLIDGETYYFQPRQTSAYGRALTGWQQIGGYWYYFNTLHNGRFGALLTGWVTVDDEKFYLDPATGRMTYGMQTIGGEQYYFSEQHDGSFGVMQTGWVFLNDGYYYFKEDGALVRGTTFQDAGREYTVNFKGRLVSGWAPDGASYFVNGMAVSGMRLIDGERYYFDPSSPLGGKYVNKPFEDTSTGAAYFAGADGAAVKDTWRRTSWPDGDGWEYYGSDGARASGWTEIGGYRYYFYDGKGKPPQLSGVWHRPAMGQMVTGWMVLDDGTYYLEDDTGRMAVGIRYVGEELYCFDSDGKLQEDWKPDEDQAPSGRWLTDGTWRWYDPKTGMQIDGFVRLEDQLYYTDPAAEEALVGWVEVDGETYYIHPETGHVLTGCRLIDGKWYFFDEKTGAMVTGWMDVEYVGCRYFQPKTGAMALGEELSVDGKTVRFDETGEAFDRAGQPLYQ